jgi:broad specificity phosphatase PhoE
MHDPILVVGHAAVNRVFLKIWLNLSPEQAMRIKFSHDTLYDINQSFELQAKPAIFIAGLSYFRQ